MLDRTSVEVFAEDGLAMFSDCFLPPPGDRWLKLDPGTPDAVVPLVEVRTLKSAWHP